ncbi:hypothetical protein [Vibrio coralliilyticus]
MAAWRTHFAHQHAQRLGQASLFADYRIQVAHVVRDYGMQARQEVPM